MKTARPITIVYDNHLLTIPAGTRIDKSIRPDYFKVLDLSWLDNKLLYMAMNNKPILIHEELVELNDYG